MIERYRREEAERVRDERASGTARAGGLGTLKAQHARPALVIGLTLAALQQFAGMSTGSGGVLCCSGRWRS